MPFFFFRRYRWKEDIVPVHITITFTGSIPKAVFLLDSSQAFEVELTSEESEEQSPNSINYLLTKVDQVVYKAFEGSLLIEKVNLGNLKDEL